MQNSKGKKWKIKVKSCLHKLFVPNRNCRIRRIDLGDFCLLMVFQTKKPKLHINTTNSNVVKHLFFFVWINLIFDTFEWHKRAKKENKYPKRTNSISTKCFFFPLCSINRSYCVSFRCCECVYAHQCAFDAPSVTNICQNVYVKWLPVHVTQTFFTIADKQIAFKSTMQSTARNHSS